MSATAKRSDKEVLAFVKAHVEALQSLLSDPQPGLYSWCQMFGDHLKALSDYWNQEGEWKQ